MRPWILNLYRAGVVVVLAGLLADQARWRAARDQPLLSLAQARKHFPNAARLGPRDPERGVRLVFDADGSTLGCVLATSPESDSIIGYSGPNNLMIALGRDGAIVGLELIHSADTEEHVGLIRDHKGFLPSFAGWNSRKEESLRVEAVSGATLTSLAIVEAVQKRLTGSAPSLRFPKAVALADVAPLFTNAAALIPDGPRLRVQDGQGGLLGYAVRTSPEADNVSGYRGPTEGLVGLGPDGERVVGVRLLETYDTESYVDQVRRDRRYLERFEGRTAAELAAWDMGREKVEGVSGATQTSTAVTEGMRRRMGRLTGLGDPSAKPTGFGSWLARDWGLAGAVLGAMLMAFTRLRGHRVVRWIWQAFLIGYIGWMNGDLLSLALLGGWAAHGAAWDYAPGLLLLAAASLVTPLATRRQVYCHQLCPHGAAQQWLGAIRRRRRAAPRRAPGPKTRAAVRHLERLPVVLLIAGTAMLLIGLPFDLANLEPFAAWSWKAAGMASIILAVIGLVASIFIPQAYCRFGCPTGALLGFARSTGSGDRWGARDWTALGVLVASFAFATSARLFSSGPPEPEPVVLSGRTMGTTWTVKVRGEVQNPAALEKAVAREFDWAESMTSHWRTNTDVSIFNRSTSADPVPVPWPVTKLTRMAQDISEATGGAFDITVGPLVRLWGFGPGPRRDAPPAEEEIGRVRGSLGWDKLEVLDLQLRKRVAGLEIDLSAIAPGWAADQIAALLEGRGYQEFLVETGGELRALGRWKIAIEHPSRTCLLTNESIGTSGNYRQHWEYEGRRYSHLLDPRTGRPIAHRTVSVSVVHPSCALADAWAAALNVMGVEAGLPLAESRGLAAQFVVERDNGKLDVRSTTAWGRR